MAKIFITGVAGFLGWHLADALLAAGHEVGGNDNLSGGDISNVPHDVAYHHLDCNHRDELAAALVGYTHLVHCAAAPYEGLSFFSPEYITRNIVGAAVASGVGRIVHCSSMARYGAQESPFREDQQPTPQDPYGIGKLATESLLRNLCETHDIEYSIAVPGNIIGPRQAYDDPFRGVTSIMINLALRGRELIIFGDGEQKRRFAPVDSCVNALMRMTFDSVKSGEIINIGPTSLGTLISINDLAALIWGACGHNGPPRIRYLPDRVGDVKFAYCDVAKSIQLLGHYHGLTLEQCILDMIYDVRKRGPKSFNYDLPIEIRNHKTPAAWMERLF